MNITNNVLNLYMRTKEEYEGEFDNYLNLANLNISKVTLATKSYDLGYLSLQNNHLKSLDILKFCPNLWSLDVRGNHIDNFQGISDHCLGYLAVTLDKYNYSYLFHQKKFKIGILKAEGYYEENDQYWNFIYNSQSNILKFNEEIILFNNERNFEFLKTNKFSNAMNFDGYSSNKFSIFSSSTIIMMDSLSTFISEYNKGIREILESHLTNAIKQNKIDHSRRSELINNDKLFNSISLSPVKKSSEEISFLNLPRKVLRKQNSNNIFQQLLDVEDLNLVLVPEYMILEKKKIIMIIQIFDSLKNNQFDMCFRSKLLKIKDEFILIFILNVLILYFTHIIDKELAAKISIIVLKNVISDPIKIKNIFSLEIVYLIGLYYEIHSKLTEVLKSKNEKVTPIVELLEMNDMILHVNLISKKHVGKNPIYKQFDNNSLCMRKILIHSEIIKFLEQELKSFSKFAKIFQYFFDYLIKNNIDQFLMKSSPHSYRVMLEIHSYFIEYLEKSNNPNKTLKKGLTLKEYDNYQIERLKYDFYFTNLSKMKKLIKKDSYDLDIMPIISNNSLPNSKKSTNTSYNNLSFSPEPLTPKQIKHNTENVLSFSEYLNSSPIKPLDTKLAESKLKSKLNLHKHKTLKTININNEVHLNSTLINRTKTDLFKIKTRNKFLFKKGKSEHTLLTNSNVFATPKSFFLTPSQLNKIE